jgi:hypothetical protein
MCLAETAAARSVLYLFVTVPVRKLFEAVAEFESVDVAESNDALCAT